MTLSQEDIKNMYEFTDAFAWKERQRCNSTVDSLNISEQEKRLYKRYPAVREMRAEKAQLLCGRVKMDHPLLDTQKGAFLTSIVKSYTDASSAKKEYQLASYQRYFLRHYSRNVPANEFQNHSEPREIEDILN